MVTGDVDNNGLDEVIIDFGATYGIWIRMNNSSWSQLHSLSPDSMVTGDMDNNGQDDVIIDFGNTYGLWVRMNNSSWVQLHSLSADSMVTGNIDGLASVASSNKIELSDTLPDVEIIELPEAELGVQLP